MKPNLWTTSSFCEAGACVSVQWKTGCEAGDCVQVGFRKADASADTNCVEVGHAEDMVLVRDSKDPDGQVITFTEQRWASLLDAVKAGRYADLESWLFPLTFTGEELAAFRSGCKSGEFDLEETS
jgi:hypothetical protein